MRQQPTLREANDAVTGVRRKRTTKTAKLSEKQLQATSSAATIAAKSQDRKPRGGAKASKNKVQKSKPSKAKATEQKPLHMLRIENPHEHRARKLRPSRLRFDWSEDTENEPQSMRRASI